MTESDTIKDLYPEPELTEDISNQSLFKNKNFMVLWIGQTVSNVGSFFAFIALLFLTLRLSEDFSSTGQAQALAIVTLVQVIPVVILGPFSGVIVDRFDRKKIMIIADFIGALTSFSLVIVSALWHVYALAGLYSIIRIFFYPARSAAIPLIVDPEKIMQANSYSQTTMQLSRIIGPALSGFVIALYGIKSAFIIDGTSFLFSVLMISLVTANIRPEDNPEKLTIRSSLSDLKEGFSISAQDRVLRFLLVALVVFMIGISMIDPLFAYYVTTEFGLDESDFGLIISLSAVVGFISAILFSIKGDVDRKLLFVILAMVVGSVSIFIIGYAPNLPSPIVGLYLGMAIVGAVNVLLMIPVGTLIQTIVENRNMGKVNGIMGSLISLTQAGGAAISGWLVIYLTVSWLYMIIGLFLIICASGFYRYLKSSGLDQEAQERILVMKEIKKSEMIARQESQTSIHTKPDLTTETSEYISS